MKKFLKIIGVIIILGVIGAAIGGYYFYGKIFKSNVTIKDNESVIVYIPTHATYQEVLDSLYAKNIINDKITLEWVMKQKNYKNNIYAGRYEIINGMSNNDLVDLLRSGKQSPIKVTFNNIRLKTELAGRISKQITADSTLILEALNNEALISELGFTTENILVIFIPNTYELYWNTSAEQFVRRMHKEYQNFWTEERKSKATKTGLSEIEVSILASIVQAEQTLQKSEQPIIAGLYINRLNKKIPLSSCPTLIYAHGDFSIKRVLDKHIEIESPYNTYKYAGLPPGPITLPEIRAIDAVLNYEKTDYLYMCAKEDFSGYHYFSKILSQHLNYAKRYHNAANKRGVK